MSSISFCTSLTFFLVSRISADSCSLTRSSGGIFLSWSSAPACISFTCCWRKLTFSSVSCSRSLALSSFCSRCRRSFSACWTFSVRSSTCCVAFLSRSLAWQINFVKQLTQIETFRTTLPPRATCTGATTSDKIVGTLGRFPPARLPPHTGAVGSSILLLPLNWC